VSQINHRNVDDIIQIDDSGNPTRWLGHEFELTKGTNEKERAAKRNNIAKSVL
jgi:hypothetical protein